MLQIYFKSTIFKYLYLIICMHHFNKLLFVVDVSCYIMIYDLYSRFVRKTQRKNHKRIFLHIKRIIQFAHLATDLSPRLSYKFLRSSCLIYHNFQLLCSILGNGSLLNFLHAKLSFYFTLNCMYLRFSQLLMYFIIYL